MKRASKPAGVGKVPGVYWRKDRQCFWFSKRVKGRPRVYIDLETADQEEAIARARVAQESPVLKPARGILTEIDIFIAERSRLEEYSEASATTIRSSLKRFAGFVDERAPATVQRDDVERYYVWLTSPAPKGAGVTPNSANTYLQQISAFFSWLIEKKKVRSNPCKGVKRIKVRGGARLHFLPYEVFQKLIAEAPGDDLRFILYCGFHAGMRKNEIVNARPEWFDLPGRTIRITSMVGGFNRKTRKTDANSFVHPVPMSAEFHAFLSRWEIPSPYCLAPEVTKGKSLYRYNFRGLFENYMTAKGVRCTPHTMRHSFASQCVARDVPFIKIAKWMGDAVKTVEKHYAHLRPDDRSIDAAFPFQETATGSSSL